MKTTEAWSSGVYPHLYDWMDSEQVARNRIKWRAAVHHLGDHWLFLRVQERLDPKVRDLPVRKAVK
jgi:hypothetical protein